MSEKRKSPKTAIKEVEGVVVGRGDNKRIVDPSEVEKLAKLWCSYEEMADFFDINAETLKYNFGEVIKKGRAETKQALRRAQLKLALEGDRTMLIWLGKQILGQSETPRDTSESDRILPWSD
jgi:hypothetical protein